MALKFIWSKCLFKRPGAASVFLGFLAVLAPAAAGRDAVAGSSTSATALEARVLNLSVRRAVAVDPLPSDLVPQPPSAEEAMEDIVRGTDAGTRSQAPLRLPEGWRPLEHRLEEVLRADAPAIGTLPALYQAVLQNDEEWLHDILADGADPNEITPGGDTALNAAIRHGHLQALKALLLAGADPHLPGYEKQPPIAVASLRRGWDILAALLAAGADPNARFATPVSREILNRVNIKDLRNALENDRGVTPLMCCAARGDVEGAAELLNAGAKPSICTTRYKRYPINFAAVQGYLFLMRIILGRQPESEPNILVTVNLSQQRAWLMKEGQIIDSCAVSTGRAGYATPAGRYVITDKHRSWTSTLYHVAMPYFMRLNCGAIGLHSGYVTGRPASHGCIRLPHAKAQKFFAMVRVGDEVQIVH